MLYLSIEQQMHYNDLFHDSCREINFHKVDKLLNNSLVDIDFVGDLIMDDFIISEASIQDILEFFEYLKNRGLKHEHYLFSMPDLMQLFSHAVFVEMPWASPELDPFFEKYLILALEVSLINGIQYNYPEKTAYDILFDYTKESPVLQSKLLEQFFLRGATSFFDLSSNDRLLNSDIPTAYQYNIPELHTYFDHRQKKNWNYPSRQLNLQAILFDRQRNRRELKESLQKIENIFPYFEITESFQIIVYFLEINYDLKSNASGYGISKHYSSTELTQVLQMLFRHEELSWQFKLSEVKNPLLLEEIAEYLRSGGHHEVADQFLFRASLA